MGDTVTWTNAGPSTHTATASDGSFDTGQLKRGQSASHTFTHAGAFAYVCQIHPFMHGTIVVLANPTTTPVTPSPTPSAQGAGGAGSGTGAGTTAPTGSNGASTGTAAPANGQLPFTGMDLTRTLIWALALLVGGFALRRATVLRRVRR